MTANEARELMLKAKINLDSNYFIDSIFSNIVSDVNSRIKEAASYGNDHVVLPKYIYVNPNDLESKLFNMLNKHLINLGYTTSLYINGDPAGVCKKDFKIEWV